MNKAVQAKVKLILSNANEEAKLFDGFELKPEYILLAILNDSSDPAFKVFKELQVDIPDLQETISEYLRNTDLTPRVNQKVGEKLPLAENTKKLFNILDEESESLGDKEIKTQHMVLGILKAKNNLSQILDSIGVTYNIYKKMIIKLESPDKDIKNNVKFDDNEPEDIDFEPVRKSKKKETKTPALDSFCRDITRAVENNEIDPVIGREKEIIRLAQILSRKKKNNPILCGLPGTGKTAIVEGLAVRIKEGNVPRTLLDKKIYSLDMASVVAGTKYRGDFEARMVAILDECKKNKNIILFVDELHTIIGAGNASGSLDASNIFKPALARGEMQLIGATTFDEYREHIEKDGALTRRFQQLNVNEPTLEETITILKNIKSKFEEHHKVTYTDEAIEECAKLSDRYINERAMPDKAIDLLDEAGAHVNIGRTKPIKIRELEQKIKVLNANKKIVVLANNYEEAANIRKEETKLEDQLSKENDVWEKSFTEKSTFVGVEQVSEVISMMTGIPLQKISTQESKKLMNLDKELMGKIIGQDEAVTKVVKAIKRNRIGLKNNNKSIGVFILLGQSGTGKSMLAKLLAENIFGDTDSLVRIDMSEYSEKFNISRLIGAPPGYVGYEEGGQLTEKVRRKQYCVVLLDEIEKAHDEIYNLLLQILDEGHVTDGLGRKINFKNTLIIMTSNLGVSELSNFGNGVGFQTSTTLANKAINEKAIIEKALKKKFKPEFLNRIDATIVFNKLTPENIHKIVYNEITELKKRLVNVKNELTIDEEAIKFLATEGYNEEFGARPLKRVISNLIEDPIVDLILNGDVKEGDTINITFDSNNKTLIIKPTII